MSCGALVPVGKPGIIMGTDQCRLCRSGFVLLLTSAASYLRSLANSLDYNIDSAKLKLKLIISGFIQ